MSRIHDMGGRDGEGAVDASDDAIFAKDWHARALAVTVACGFLGQWNIDTSRHARERLSARDYARFSYYEKWISALADMMVEQGILTRDELASGQAAGVSDLAEKVLLASQTQAALAKGGPSARESDVKATFAIGDRVRTRLPARNRLVKGGHTRMAGYAAGMEGRVVMDHGAHVFPDSNAHSLGEAPEPLYGVAFDAAVLWGKAEQDGDEVVLDLWQSYLEPA